MKSMTPKLRGTTLALVLAAAGALAACGDDTPAGEVVARAGDYTFTVDEATELLVDQENLPNQVQVVDALAELWIDYTLLAAAVARDTTLEFMDLEAMVRSQVEQQMIFQLRDSVIQVDTAIADDELRSLYESTAPGAELRARHVLLGLPQGATQAQRDSVRAVAEDVQQQAVSGASFEDLARRYSQDPGTASDGGDLGYVGRGDLVRPIDEALFAMEVGEVSDVVESPFGYHVLRLEDRRTPDFEQVRAQFRVQAQNRRYLTAESTFVAGVEAGRTPEIADGAFDIVRDLAEDPGRRLSSRAARRPLMTYDGGAYTVGEFQMLVQAQPAQDRGQIVRATEEQLGNFLRGLAQRKMLVAEARSAGLEPSAERVDSLENQVRDRIRQVADAIGVLRLERAPGEAVAPAVDRAVTQALLDVLNGATDVVPLGQIAYQLRERRPTSVNDAGVGQVVLRVGQQRATRSPSPVEGAQPMDTTDASPLTPGNP